MTDIKIARREDNFAISYVVGGIMSEEAQYCIEAIEIRKRPNILEIVSIKQLKSKLIGLLPKSQIEVAETLCEGRAQKTAQEHYNKFLRGDCSEKPTLDLDIIRVS